MREIKFRVWDTESKQFLKEIPVVKEWLGSYIDDPEHAAFDDPEQMDPFFYPENLCRTFDGRLIYQQWTGLTDKDGKEIYEGDVLEYFHTIKPKLTVEYSDRCGCFKAGRYFMNTNFDCIYTHQYKVVGHIYDGINRAN